MTLEQRIAKLKAALAERHANPAGLSNVPGPVRGLMNRDAESFTAGADALAEVSRLRGYLEALEWADDKLDDVGLGQYRQLWDHQEVMKEKLEALLKQMEEKV